MALSFPTDPTSGDTYVAPNGYTYTWDGGNVTFDPGTAIRIFSTNIWKRVAWSGDIW